MQVFATSKAPALGRALYQQLTCLVTKHRKAVRIMKLTAIFLVGACLQMSANGISQTITLSFKDAPIQKVFREIERQTDYTFFIEADFFGKAKKVTVLANNLPLNQVLDICFKDQAFTYSFSGKIIMVTPKRNKQVSDINTAALQKLVDIRGRVVNSKGEPIPDATVSIKGSDKRVITNANGEFTINGVEDNAVVVITHVQYETMSLPIKGNGPLSATLQLRVSSLDELQVIAYGTTTKRFSTGNIATVKSSDIEKQPVQNPLLALQGRVTGIEITQLTGMSGGGVKVRIQGQNSINQGNDPLVVIDGVPYPSQLYSSSDEGLTQYGSPLSYINPNDIESIDILKDADATAIYGSRAANGAVLITTKKGKSGRTKVDVDMQQGWSEVARKVDMMNTRQYLDMRYEAFKNDGIPLSSLDQTDNYDLTVWDSTRYTDWQKELIGGTAQYTNVNATVSGGVPTIQYLISGTYNRRTNVFPGNFDDKRGSLHFSITGGSNNQRFRIQLSGNYMLDKNQLPNVDLTQYAIQLAPNAPRLYSADGTLNWEANAAGTSTFLNPLAYLVGSSFNNTTKNIVNNLSLSYRILPGLEARTSIGYTNTSSNLYMPFRLEILPPEQRIGFERQTLDAARDMSSWIFEPQLEYSKLLGKGKLEALFGGTILQSRAKYFSVGASGYSTDLLMQTLSAATSVSAGISSSTASKFNSLFARLNYVWNSKYLLNLTARRDASSKFGDANKLHDFGSIGIGWIFSEEAWLNKNLKFLSYGKLRGSYGTTGNDQIDDFGHLSLYTISKPTTLYQGGINIQVSRLPNPHLQWEETRKLQAGIDLGFLKDRILINITYVRNRSSNQLISYTLPSTTGFTRISQNLPALVQNNNWEFTANGTVIKSKDFLWSASTNLTIPRNKLVSFPNIANTSFKNTAFGVIVGYGLGAQMVYPSAGVDPATGLYQVYDKDGKPTFSPNFINDATKTLSNFTKFYGGLQNSISYKGIQLDFTFQYVRQFGTKDLYYTNGNYLPGAFTTDIIFNQPVSVLNRWQNPGDIATIQKFSTTNTYPSDALLRSDAFYSYDPSFIRLKNASLSWQFPSKWIKRLRMQNAKLYCLGQNLATITKYKGLDPETKSVATLPPLRTITFGIQMGL